MPSKEQQFYHNFTALMSCCIHHPEEAQKTIVTLKTQVAQISKTSLTCQNACSISQQILTQEELEKIKNKVTSKQIHQLIQSQRTKILINIPQMLTILEECQIIAQTSISQKNEVVPSTKKECNEVEEILALEDEQIKIFPLFALSTIILMNTIAFFYPFLWKLTPLSLLVYATHLYFSFERT